MDAAELVRRMYEQFNAGSPTWQEDFLSEDIVYVNPPDAVEPGTRRGRDAWAAFNTYQSVFENLRWEVVELHGEGDRVLARLRSQVRGRESGLAGDWEGWHLWTVRGNRIVRYEWFNDEEAARAAFAGGPA